MRGGSAQQPAQPSADDIVAQVAAASDNLQDLGLDDMQEPIDDDEEFVDETTGKKKQRSWLGKLGKGISKRAQSIKSAVTGEEAPYVRHGAAPAEEAKPAEEAAHPAAEGAPAGEAHAGEAPAKAEKQATLKVRTWFAARARAGAGVGRA